jgi:prepilin-type N-terminal cleavage/methylation domain-containing protein
MKTKCNALPLPGERSHLIIGRERRSARAEGSDFKEKPALSQSVRRRARSGAPHHGFTLIEMIGVLAIIAILAYALVAVFIRQMDRIVGENEAKQLKAFAEGFRQRVVKTKAIAGHTTWTNVLATELGLTARQVLLNERGVERRFLIDPGFLLYKQGVSPGPPAYTQDRFGSTNRPASPRLMIVSSISVALPVQVANGVAPSTGAYSFTNIWNTPEDTMPPNWSWGGKAEDVKIQRIHLADLFVELTLNSDPSGARYAIESGTPNATPSQSYTAYFIDSSLLELYNCADPTPRYGEILHRSKSFTFANCTWQQGGEFSNRIINRPGPADMQLAADAFLAAAQNPYAAGYPTSSSPDARPTNVYSSMLVYMSNYVNWAPYARANGQNGVRNDPLGNAMGAAQTDLNDSSLALRDYNSP